MKSRLIKLIRRIARVFISKFLFKRNSIKVSSNSIFEKDYNVFFGYHDKSPFSQDGNLHLACRTKSKANDRKAIEGPLEVGYYSLNDGKPKFKLLGISDTWSWQQGCMLQFLPNRENRIIYNTTFNGESASVIRSIDSGQIVTVNGFPIYSLSIDGQFASSLNFNSLYYKRPGYGYFTKTSNPNLNAYLRIYKLDSQELVMEKNINEEYPGHYINHLLFSPDSKYVVFHLIKEGTGRNVRLCRLDLATGKLKILIKNRTISHMCWMDNSTLIISEGKKVYWQALVFDIVSAKSINERNFLFQGDFHPMYSKRYNNFVSDSYQINGYQSLYLTGMDSGVTKVLAREAVDASLKGETRCDFHPRFNSKEDSISIDIGVNNKRGIKVYKLDEN